jgi:phosphatidylserine/phosphatidylglycerophosphate/cardiolipin synthase-like enzyme
MYQFHAKHIAEAIEEQLEEQASLKLIVANQTHNPSNNKIAKGNFDRAKTFKKWDQEFEIERVYVPLGSSGLVANSYHIKVTVRNGKDVWLSSGNWTRSSQPLIAESDLDNPKTTGAAGNREWHVVLQNKTLADRFSNHLKADYERSLELGGTPEAPEQLRLVDVPLTALEAMELEAAPSQVVEPLPIKRTLRIKPLLTSDKKGAVYSKAVLDLIRSAKKQLLFQNQYIKMSGAKSGFLKELVDALAYRAQNVKDCRIILRSGDSEMRFNLTELKKRGIDVNKQVKILANTHTKGIVVDGKRVLLGSHNWSSSGVTLNRDASLIVDDADVAKYFQDVFEIDWDRSRPPKLEEVVEERVRPAEGDEPPVGFVCMTLAEFLEQ